RLSDFALEAAERRQSAVVGVNDGQLWVRNEDVRLQTAEGSGQEPGRSEEAVVPGRCTQAGRRFGRRSIESLRNGSGLLAISFCSAARWCHGASLDPDPSFDRATARSALRISSSRSSNL